MEIDLIFKIAAVGIIVSFYVLFNKEAVATGAKRVLYCIFTVEAAEKILEGVRFTDKTFMDFISGKILDSAIIGILCYICCSLMNMPYTLLVAVIVGVTNVIPFFGPFIGAIPSAFIILLVDPMKCLIFLVFILILQQFDGNILGPKILGSSTGVNGFWIMFAIIIGGGFFGFMGMLLGVPVFVVIYSGIKNLTRRKLRRSGLPEDYESYENLHHIDPKTGEHIEMPPQPRPEERRAKIDDYAARFELTDDLAQPIAAYSHGMKQKLAVISALLHEPRLIIMDEPFVGLDPKASHILKEIMRDICNRGGAIFFSTHVLEVAEKLCDKVAIIKDGRLIKSGTMEQVRGDTSLEDVFLELEDDNA